jgi:hypothetical protein
VKSPARASDLLSSLLRLLLTLVEFWTETGKLPDCADEVPYDFKAECEKARQIPKQEFGF